MSLGRNEAELLLTPHAATIVEMYRTAISEMKASGLFPFQRKSTQASVLSDLVGRKLEQLGLTVTGSSPSITVIRRNGSPRAIVSGILFARFKKAGGRNRVGRNIMTKAEAQFLDPMFPDAEFPQLEKVEFVYTLDNQTQDLIRLEVVSRNGDSAAWRFDLLDDGLATMPLPFALPPSDGAADERRAKVVLKKGNAKDRGAESA
jgi:hypothetical protein